MKKVKMITEAKGSIDGVNLLTFDAGMVYDLPDSLADGFVIYMKVAEYLMEQPVMKFEVPERSYKVVTLKDKPKKWVGMEIRSKDGGPKLKVMDVIRGGTVILSDDRHVSYGVIRKHWEIV